MHFRLIVTVLFALQVPVTFGQTGTTPFPAAPPKKTLQTHEHGIRDVEQIGDRNVGCGRGLGNWYSLEQQSEMGKKYARQIDATNPFVLDPIVTAYVDTLGQNIVRNSDAHIAFKFKIIDSDEVNALALPGGYLYLTSGAILASDNEAELAAIMAHEIAHVAACHAVRVRTRKEWMDIASFPLSIIGGPIGYAALQGLSIASPFATQKYSRNFESEADFLGVQYVYKAGYDPQALIAFFERARSGDGPKRNRVVEAFRTHPRSLERIQKMAKEIELFLPGKPEYKVDTSEFQDVKLQLNQYENRRNGSYQKPGTPTLRRRVSQPEGEPKQGDPGKLKP
jgi:beta-barrel assembly-enhancing protease